MSDGAPPDMAPDPPTYPEHWEADVVLRDGSTMRIRPIHPGDGDALQRFHSRQSPESVYLRFFAPLTRLPDKDLHRFTHVDHRDRVALVVTWQDEIIAVGRFDQIAGGDAEVAFNVSDSAQGKGLGSVLLEHLAAAGRELGVRRFVADVLPQNSRMLRVFTDAGYDVEQTYDDGIMTVSFTIRPTDRSMAVLAERERRAEALSMAAVLAPRRVLLVCAGAEGRSFGERLAGQLAGTGRLRVVGLPGHPATLAELEPAPEEDLALLAADAPTVLELVPDLAAHGIKAVVLYTGGFAVDPGTTKVAQRTLVTSLRRHGLRLVGPRSFGVLSSTADPVEATLWRGPLRQGTVGIFCQSAAAGLGLLSGAAERGLGISSFLSAGHRLDVSGNDTMQFWTSDERTRVACLRLESIGNPRKFSRVARRLSEKGPVVAMIAGSTGQLNPPGHAVRTTAEPRKALDELMRQAGVLVADSEPALLDLAGLLTEQPLPTGDRVVVLTNSGTQAAILAELIEHHGLSAAIEPIALPAGSGGAAYAEQIRELTDRSDWDAAIIGYVPLLTDDGAAVAEQVRHLATGSDRTTLACLFGVTGLLGAAEDGADGPRVPTFPSAEAAVAAVAAAREYHRWRHSDRGARVDPSDIDRRAAKSLVQSALADLPPGSSKRLSGQDAERLLGCYGITTWPERRVSDERSALAAADELGWPVALKPADEVLRHRTDLGGVRLDLSTPSELAEAYTAAAARVASIIGHPCAFDIQPMAPPGAGCVVRAAEDELYGPIVSLGLAGDAVELLGDVSYRVPPLTATDVTEMIGSLRAAPRLYGHRGMPRLDVAALEDVLARVSVLKEELAEVSGLVLHPVLVGEQGAAVLGVRVDVAHPRRGDVARRVLP
ncbi:MAG TPA: GNAT family N-acetyltransferase [Candidatus Ruania gallistercoris]|uniref:GNAT family N-acetyltransferase n=1 Tax=Candidatus Ruania gallistercoris TaxID=2838746 RepID=A0A9D2J5G4_9MICO|nr:GNAT family N-acetyltransferase [Candidatus Ruania gallistercoris]